jgi:hypothetical protein
MLVARSGVKLLVSFPSPIRSAPGMPLKSLPEGKALWLIIRCGRWRMFADRKYCPMDSANEKR